MAMMCPVFVVGNKNMLVYKENEEVKEMEIENNVDGVNKLIQWLKDNNVNTIIVVGNYEWAKPFVVTLKTFYPDIKVKYYPSPKKGKGERENLRRRAVNLIDKLEKGVEIVLKEYRIVEEQTKKKLVLREPETYRLSLEYIRIANQVRRIKHKIYSVIRYIAPELLEEVERYLKSDKLPTDIFDLIEDLKKDKTRLTYYIYNNNPEYFEQKVEQLRSLFLELLDYLDKKKEALEEIARHIDRNHPLIKLIIGGKRKKIPDSIYVLLGFIGNDRWTYKRLKTYIGLDTIPQNGRRRLDRRRPEVRQYFYIVAKTTALGKEAWQWFTEKYQDDEKYQQKFRRYRGTMLIESFLQYICRELGIWK